MPLIMVRNDITTMAVDAIVNAANHTLLGGGGVDGAIHRCAGPELLEECRTLGGCATGNAKITKGYRLPCKYVIHAVGPRYVDGNHGEAELLRSCYVTALTLAEEHECETIAFPLISAGIYGYPKDEAMKIAIDAVSDFLLKHDMTVYIVVYGSTSLMTGRKLFADIAEYIDDQYVSEHQIARDAQRSLHLSEPASYEVQPLVAPQVRGQKRKRFSDVLQDLGKKKNREIPDAAPEAFSVAAPRPAAAPLGLDELLGQIDESFSQMLLRKIDEKGMTDAECYRKANIDRKLFSKIRNDIHYKPSKPTVLAFAIALELPLSETRDMLMKAGFALSHSNKFDIIVEYFIANQNYNIFEINEALFAFDQSLLGA